jgi:hypothetical protein
VRVVHIRRHCGSLEYTPMEVEKSSWFEKIGVTIYAIVVFGAILVGVGFLVRNIIHVIMK